MKWKNYLGLEHATITLLNYLGLKIVKDITFTLLCELVIHAYKLQLKSFQRKKCSL